MSNWPLFLTPAQRSGLIAHLTEMYAHSRSEFRQEAERISELLGHPNMDLMEPEEFRARMSELIR